jgi:arylformamidase
MPTTNRPFARITRRALVAGAAAGTLALANEPAAAQPCPLVPPPRTKGPLVWLDMDQHELDDAYDQDVYAYNGKIISGRRDARNQIALREIGKPERVGYGTDEREKVDIWKTKRTNAPVLIFLHGGAWRGGRSSQAAYIAEPFVKAGAHFVSVDFYNAPEVNGDLMPMIDQSRRAVAWVYRNAAGFGGDPNALYLGGFSSGSHLGGCALITDWAKDGLPLDLLKGAILGSGMYDLKPVRLSKRSDYVRFTDEVEQALSPQRHLERIHTPVVITTGTLETPEFQRQSRDFAAALKAAGKPAELVIGEGHNHYEMQESLGNPYGVMGRAAMAMMKLTTRA